jgi:glycosyl transferase family 25
MSNMEQQLKKIAISYERISAIKGANLTVDEISNEYSASLNKKKFRANLSLGEIGCYISHKKIWRQMVEKEIEFAIILEDDLTIQSNFVDIFSDINNLKKYELIKLSDNRSYPAVQNKKISNQFDLINFKKIPNCTTGYTLNLAGAKKLLARNKFYRPVDIDIQFCKELDLSVFGLRPYPITEDNSFESNIATLNGGSHGNKTTSFFRNIKYRLTLWYLRKTHISGIL